MLDATSKLAEGFKNTASSSFDKPNEDRIRFPRAFYDLFRLNHF